MWRFVFGLLFGLALVAAAGYGYVRKIDGCFSLCGAGTVCEAHKCVVSLAPPSVAEPLGKDTRRKRRNAHSSTGGSQNADLTAAAPEVVLHPGDEKMLTQGDALGRAERIDMTKPGDDGKELTQDDLDRVFRPSDSAITRCITDAMGNAPLEGKVEIGFRVESSGIVSKVRVEAATLLQRNGLTACIRKTVAALHFPASGGANVVTYPFELK